MSIGGLNLPGAPSPPAALRRHKASGFGPCPPFCRFDLAAKRLRDLNSRPAESTVNPAVPLVHLKWAAVALGTERPASQWAHDARLKGSKVIYGKLVHTAPNRRHNRLRHRHRCDRRWRDAARHPAGRGGVSRKRNGGAGIHRHGSCNRRAQGAGALASCLRHAAAGQPDNGQVQGIR